jgi:Glucose-6-phosphate dehydrogenase, NAD binding domain
MTVTNPTSRLAVGGQRANPEPSDALVVFGATGDLAHKQIFPAWQHMIRRGTLHAVFPESAIFRIDHYLGKEAVDNLLFFRLANTFLEPIWSRNYGHTFQTGMFGWKGALSPEQRVQIAANVPGFIGFALGRTTSWEPLITWRDQKSAREAPVAELARRYGQCVNIFEKA